MADLDEGLAKAAVELLVPFRDIIERITGPWATQIGLSFGDRALVYRVKQEVRLWKKVKRLAADAGFELRTVAPRLLFPILGSAFVEDDENLHDRWAALLINASVQSSENEVLPSFPNILEQLTPAEARFLDAAYDETNEDETGPKRQIGQTTLTSASPIMIGNLERLGLLTRHMEDDFSSHTTTNKFATSNHLYVSSFGRAFILACRAPKCE